MIPPGGFVKLAVTPLAGGVGAGPLVGGYGPGKTPYKAPASTPAPRRPVSTAPIAAALAGGWPRGGVALQNAISGARGPRRTLAAQTAPPRRTDMTPYEPATPEGQLFQAALNLRAPAGLPITTPSNHPTRSGDPRLNTNLAVQSVARGGHDPYLVLGYNQKPGSGGKTQAYNTITQSPAIVGIHELEHTRQVPAPAGSSLYGNNPTQAARVDAIYNAAHEIPANLSEFVHRGAAHQMRGGDTSQIQIPLSPGHKPYLSDMMDDARREGHLGGSKTVTELLSTPAGSKWLEMLMRQHHANQP